jgi:hypothetical protein
MLEDSGRRKLLGPLVAARQHATGAAKRHARATLILVIYTINWLDMPRPRPQHYHHSISVLTFRTPIKSYAVIGRMGLAVLAGNEHLPVTHTRGAFSFGDNRMHEYNEYVARAAVCEQRAKDARTESEKQSWLVMADSWRETVKLQEMLTRQAEFIRKVPMPRAAGGQS